MRNLALIIFLAGTLDAQPAARNELLHMTDELEAAMRIGNWPEANRLSRALNAKAKEARNVELARDGQELTDTILTWLPADTETVVVARQPFTLRTQDDRSVPTAPTALSYAQRYLMILISSAEGQKLYPALIGSTVRLAVLGARRFGEERMPSSLGMISYHGCAIYSFAEPIADSILPRPSDETILGHRVWTSKGSTKEDSPDSTTYFVSLLKPDLALVCNHRAFFTEMVTRMAAPAPPYALPTNLPEWKQVDRTAPLWAISHYSRESSFLSSLVPGLGEAGATGITVEFGLPSDATRARMLALKDPWKRISNSGDFRGAAVSKQMSSGVWELSVNGQPDAASFAVFVLMGMLGFAVMV